MSKKTSVLYVDDEPINLKLFELNLVNIFNITTASSGFEGLEILKKNPDIPVVVSDMRMPKMNGLEFIAKAKKEFPNTVFYILTGYDINEQIADALNDRLINKYFRKPLNYKEIETAIIELML
ncbi:MAG: response regulator [Bacteroidales bacterium]|jgi:response regulator RpfG family c-di-GMP phosphodiesterase|nr:response regulator [Bacteroidales bacterium]MDD4385236.1 response regulator [Bacteroidales bacterium]MDY0198334.1 response regulator [Tenuifilaceae bacterium]